MATIQDVDVILHHRRCMFADMGDGSAAARDAMVSSARPLIEESLRNGSYRGWLAEVDGRVVVGGGVALVAYQPTPFDAQPRRAWILNMYTEPAFRHQGLARQLLESIVAWCREAGLQSVSLHASDAGRRLYEQFGFTPTNEMRLVLRE